MRQEKLFNFKYIGIALIFLIDFNINNIDILPDFIAVFLILKAIGKTYFINESFAEARVYLKVFYIVSIIKFTAGMIYLLVLRSSHSDYDSMIMTMTFIFVIFELGLSVLIFKRIFRGLEEFSYMSGSFNNMKTAGTALNILIIFFIIKSVLTFAVQTPFLLSDSDLESLSLSFNTFFTPAFLKDLLLPPCFIIQTLLGIFMLSIVAPFFFNIAKDQKMCDYINSKITSKLTEDFFFKLRLNLKSAFAFFIAGCVFFVDLRLEQIIFLPDFMICVLFFLGVSQIAGNDRDMINKKLNIYLLINFVISTAAYILNSIYSVRIFTAFADQRPDLYNLKILADLFYHISVILFFLIFIELYYFIKKLQHKHMQFTSDYLKKYFTAGEKLLYKNKNLVLRTGAAVFCVKTGSSVLPRDNGLIMFLYVLTLTIFTVWAIKLLVSAKENIYNYYN